MREIKLNTKDMEKNQKELIDNLNRLIDLNAQNYSEHLELGVALTAAKYDLAMEYRLVSSQIKK